MPDRLRQAHRARAERTAKYNQLMRIEEELGNNGSYGR